MRRTQQQMVTWRHWLILVVVGLLALLAASREYRLIDRPVSDAWRATWQ